MSTVLNFLSDSDFCIASTPPAVEDWLTEGKKFKSSVQKHPLPHYPRNLLKCQKYQAALNAATIFTQNSDCMHLTLLSLEVQWRANTESL